MRMKQSCSTYYMRHWLRLLWHSQLYCHTLCPSPCCILETLIVTHITIICGTNMNPRALQCKNFWKWRHTTFICHMHSAKCPKCNGPHKIENHRDMAWYYKVNFKKLKPQKANLVHTSLNVLIVKMTTKQTAICYETLWTWTIFIFFFFYFYFLTL